MNWFEEFQRSLNGCWLLALQRIDGYRCFNETESGFWRSFSAIVLVAPIYLWTSKIGSQSIAEAGGGDTFSVAQELCSVALQWVAWPLIMVPVCSLAGVAAGYVRYIIVYNWSSVLLMAIIAPTFVLSEAIGSAGGLTLLLSWLAIFYTLYYSWFISKTALNVSGSIASALVLGNLLVGISIDKAVAILFR